MQHVTISGNLGKDPESRTTQGGDQVLGFSVGVKQGWGEREQTNWYRVSMWGKRGEFLAKHLRKGSKVFVTGELTIGEYQGKPQFDVRAHDVDFVPTARTSEREAPGYRGPSPDDLDDTVPF